MTQQPRAGLTAGTHPCIGRRGPVADRDDEALAGEDVGLAECHVIALELSGPQHQEQRIAIEFELRPLVGVQRVLDSQRM